MGGKSLEKPQRTIEKYLKVLNSKISARQNVCLTQNISVVKVATDFACYRQVPKSKEEYTDLLIVISELCITLTYEDGTYSPFDVRKRIFSTTVIMLNGTRPVFGNALMQTGLNEDICNQNSAFGHKPLNSDRYDFKNKMYLASMERCLSKL